MIKQGLYGIQLPEQYKNRFKDFWSPSYILDYAVIAVAAVICGPLWIIGRPQLMFFRYDSDEVNVPYQMSTVSEVLVIPLVFVPAIVTLMLLQIWFRNLHDFHNALLGLIESLALNTILHVILWLCLGSPRPNFMHVCVPIPGLAGGRCQNEHDSDVINGRHNFPSGNTSKEDERRELFC